MQKGMKGGMKGMGNGHMHDGETNAPVHGAPWWDTLGKRLAV